MAHTRGHPTGGVASEGESPTGRAPRGSRDVPSTSGSPTFPRTPGPGPDSCFRASPWGTRQGWWVPPAPPPPLLEGLPGTPSALSGGDICAGSVSLTYADLCAERCCGLCSNGRRRQG